MSARLAVGIFAAFVSASADAVCVIEETLEEALVRADVVYVGTVVQSSLVSALDTIRDRSRPEVRHVVNPQVILKGNPSDITGVVSFAGYSEPTSGRFPHFAELVQVGPGDTVLVVGRAGEPSYINLCSASSMWDADAHAAVKKVFPSAP